MPIPPALMNERPTATAKCEYCEWTACHVGTADAVEVATFLRARLIAHVEENHSDRLGNVKP
jgi:hypothetical protein